MSSLSNVGNIAVMFTMLRPIDSDQMKSFISEYVNDNISAAEMPSYQSDLNQLYAAIMSDTTIMSGKTITIGANIPNNFLVYENSQGISKTITISNFNFINKVMSVIFGNTPDQDSYNLKMSILNKPILTPKGSK